MIYILALLPILALMVFSLTKGVKTAVMIALTISLALFFYWGAGFSHLVAVLGVSLLTTTNILMIVLGATFLYNIMARTGQIHKISHSLDDLHASRDIRFFLLAFGLTAFFEGVAGFGTPGAIVPLILIAMGFEAILSVSVVLLLDSLFSMFGAVGTPIVTGLQIPLRLAHIDIQKISLLAAILILLGGLVFLFFIFRLIRKQRSPLENKRKMMVLYLFFAVPYVVFAWFSPELATVLGALVMLLLSVVYLRGKSGKVDLRPWLPYAVLASLLLLPKLIPDLKQWLAWELTLTNMLDTGISGELRPLQSPLLPFLLVGLGVAWLQKSKSLHLKISLQKVANVSVILLPTIVIANLMIHSGVGQLSMVGYIANMMNKIGRSYTLLAPFVGLIGTFITGSTTISNLVFAPTQYETANYLELNRHIILSLQLSGASTGNAICLFNIIAAAAIADIKDYSGVLKNNLLPTLLVGLLLGLLGMGIMVFVG
ncbi:L-lactate permease [Olivibacter sitiensis]|uniref:L-lactate permease n=1 Tax=Olivibacter sitiensis TaxID=376470 RepID=UPI0003FDBD73|nr:L-lactate permease [Olivibacter sitiensis]